jgi:hypothetical protein
MGIVLAAGTYVHWGVVSISLTNLLILVAMIVVFVLALVVPFPGARGPATPEPNTDEDAL